MIPTVPLGYFIQCIVCTYLNAFIFTIKKHLNSFIDKKTKEETSTQTMCLLDLMEMMLIQNAQMQQWMMTNTLQRRQAEDNGRVHNHYYDAAGRPLPPIRR